MNLNSALYFICDYRDLLIALQTALISLLGYKQLNPNAF
jgi:hypothetical protein